MSDETPSPDDAPAAPTADPAAATDPDTTATEASIPTPADAPTEPTTPVAPVAAATRPVPSGHVAVPKWLLVTIVALLGAAAMFGIGYAVGDSTANNDGAVSTPFGDRNGAPSQQSPFGDGREMPGFPGAAGGQGGNGAQQPGPIASGPFLGVATQQTDDGLEVTQVVSGSGARDAGIEVGDVITEFDGNAVTTPAQLANAVRNLDVGDSVKVTVSRDGQSRTLTVTLGSRSDISN